MASGKLAFMLAGNWMPGNLALADVTCNWGYAAHPYFEGGKAVTATGCWNIGVASTSKNPEAAAEFVKFMTIGEGNDFWHEDVKSLSARTAGFRGRSGISGISGIPGFNSTARGG